MGILPITVVIPVKNEASNLPHCLPLLTDFAAIWVVDSASEDDTVAIAKKAGARIINFAWPGGFPKKRNWVLMNETFETPWVLFLDADERVTSEFVAEAARAVQASDVDGFWLNYTTHFMGGILRHGVPQRKLALFRVGAGLYERIEDPGWSHLDMEVHEHPEIAGKIGEISARIDHQDFRGINQFIDRHNAYASWEANRLREMSASGSDQWQKLTRRQKFKYRALRRWWFAPAYFFGTYFVKLGFLDGWRGLDYALLKKWYFQTIRLKLIELEQDG